MRPAAVALAVSLAATGCGTPPGTEPDPEASVAVPAGDGPRLDDITALALAAMPLACLDRPHGAPQRTGYLYELSWSQRPDFESTRAFYGCYDWHSAVNSTWTLVALMRRFEDMPLAPLVVEKLGLHLSPTTMLGEAEYFDDNPGFERPYGWAWFLALHAELTRLEHPRAADWVEWTAPLAERFANGLSAYFDRLDYPLRVGTHANSAFAIDLGLDFAGATGRTAFAASLRDHARRFYADDRACPVAFEPSGSDFLSPCLQEAALMSEVLDDGEFATWLDDFLPDPDAPEFERLRSPLRLAADADLDVAEQGARSHLIGLAFTRAEALSRIAAALGPDDARTSAYRTAAARLATWGMDTMFAADYLGSHWIGTFATRYLITLPVVE